MIRSYLSLILALPMLLPQGMCVCSRFFQKEQAHVDSSQTVACPCSHSHESDGPTACHPAERPGHSDRHVPGCPAENGTGEWKASVVKPATVSDQPVLNALIAAPPQDALHSVLAAGEGVKRPAEQPLYLTLLTLRI